MLIKGSLLGMDSKKPDAGATGVEREKIGAVGIEGVVGGACRKLLNSSGGAFPRAHLPQSLVG